MIKGSRHSDESKKRMSENNAQKRPEVRAKNSKSKKGKIPWNKGKTDIFSDETLKRISDGHKGLIPWSKGKKGVYSDETIQKMRESKKGSISWMKGKHHSVESKKKISRNNGMRRPEISVKVAESNKGRTPWNKGKKAVQKAWNKGIPQSDDAKIKSSESHKGKTAWNKGKKGCFSEEVIQKMRISHKGSKSYWKGKKLTKEHIEKLSKSHRGIKLSVRTIEKMRLRCGEKAGNWKGGISFEPYCHKFNDNLKERIRERDNRTCQLCGVKENGKKLSVHHIHYIKSDCEPDLISLCNTCNTRANGNRRFYENLFMNKLKERGIVE